MNHCFRVAAACGAALALAAPASAQSPGIDAYRTNPAPVSAVGNPLILPAHSAYAPRDRLSRARAEIARGNFRLARRLLGTGRSLSNPEAQYLAGVASANLGDYRAAGRAFAASLALAPDHVGARVGAALIDIRFARYGNAEDALRAIEARRAACGAGCRDAEALDRGAEVIRQFLGRGRQA
jgi:tetratricopeptide (TPR) repeat protein